MTIDEFDAFWEQMTGQEGQLLDQKGKEYSGTEDRFRNFKRLSAELGISAEKVTWIYLKKHLDSILSFINHIEEPHYVSSLSEPIMTRCQDARNYLALLAGMIHEKENPAGQQKQPNQD